MAAALNPPIKTRFISLPPFGQENATLFIGSITGNKVKEAKVMRAADFRTSPGENPHKCQRR
jgi:hypothetical protein